MATANYSFFTILPFRSVLAVGQRIPLCPTNFGHGLIVWDNGTARRQDTNRSFKYAPMVWFAFLLLPSALRKIWPRELLVHDEETRGTVLNPTYSWSQRIPAKLSRLTSHE